MLLNIQQLYELFESSGNYLRIHWDEDYQRLARHLAEDRIKVEKLVVEASPDGVLIRLWNFFANHQIWDEIAIARTFPQLHAIVNYGGQQHGALCLSLAAWLIDQGYTVLAESWVNGRRVDLVTECRTWLIECGDTSPKPIISHLYSGVSRVVIVPFQSQEERLLEAVTFTKSANWANNLVEQEQIVDLSSQTGQITITHQPREEKQVTSAQTSRNQVTLSADTLHALIAWVHSGDCPQTGQLLRESRKGGKLTKPGMSERAIQARVEFLGEQIGIFGLSPHDCRHHWATFWANKVDLLRLQEAGGWASLEMPRRYVERAKVANEGMA